LAPSIVDGSSDSLKVALSEEVSDTDVAPFAGATLVTTGGPGGVDATVKDHVYPPVRREPSVASIVSARLAVYVAPSVSGDCGTRRADWVTESYETAAVTAPAGPVSVKDEAVTVVASAAFDRYARGRMAAPMPESPAAGRVLDTVSPGVAVA